MSKTFSFRLNEIVNVSSCFNSLLLKLIMLQCVELPAATSGNNCAFFFCITRSDMYSSEQVQLLALPKTLILLQSAEDVLKILSVNHISIVLLVCPIWRGLRPG